MKQLAALLGVAILCGSVHADDWRQFRGNDSSGVSNETNLPKQLDDPKVLQWKTDLQGRGLSGPIVVGDRVVLTASSGYRDDRLQVLCYSSATGKLIWDRTFKATGRTICNNEMCMATPQPCSDGERIYAYYSCNDVICLDLDGNLIWYRGLGHDFPNVSSSLGMASSPVVVDGTLVLQLDTDSESIAIGLDALTGETRWKTDREKTAIWASPVLYRSSPDSKSQVILQSKKSLLSVDHRTGNTNWEVDQPCADIASATVAGDLLIAPLKQLTVLRSSGVAAPEVLWSDPKLSPDTPTPVAYRDRLYVLKKSILNCVDLKTGKVAWKLRLGTAGASSSPVAADGYLYLADQNGLLQSVRLDGEKGEVASRLDLGEKIMATPTISGGGLYLRSDQHLWKFANAK